MDNPSCWTEVRGEILAWLKRNAPSLAELYEGAVLILYQHSLPGRTRFIGHAVREIRNRLPDAFSGPTRPERLDYAKRIGAISTAWSNAGLHETAIPTDAEFRSPPGTGDSPSPIGITADVHRLINDLIIDHQNVPETRAEAAERFFEACAPENKDLGETMRPVIRNWMAVTEWFMERTHDSGDTDNASDPQEFLRKFELFESILRSLIGAFFASLDELDLILADTDVAQVDKAVALIARAEHHRYFFDKLHDARWVEPLAAKGFFRHPPPPIPVQRGRYYRVPRWPESLFLARIAGSASEDEQGRIVEIALALPETQNVSAHQDLADIALAVPPPLAVRFVPKAKKWVDKLTFSLVPLKLGELTVHLARGAYPGEALSLARHLLSPLRPHQEKKPDQSPEGHAPIPEPRARFEPLFYGEILKNHIPALVRAIGFPTFQMLCGLLESAIRHSRLDAESNKREDYSSGWRPAIEDHEQNFQSRDLPAMLVEALRDTAEQLAEADPSSVPRIVQELEQRNYPVFDRIALHLLRVRADSPPGLVSDCLTRRELFDSSNHRHEYTLLLQERFAGLDLADRERILGWIEAGPDLELFAASYETWFGRRPSAEEMENCADQYRMERLWPIRNDLPEAWRVRFATLTARYGDPEHPEFTHFTQITGATIEDRSPKTIDELRQMPVEDIASFARNWQPPGGFRGPTHEGLRFVLMKLVAEEPARFALAPHFLEELPPAHLLTALDGFQEAIKAGRSFPWPAVLDVCRQLLSRRKGDPAGTTDREQSSDDLSPLTDRIAGLLESALERHPVPIPFDQRHSVIEILQRLAAAPDPSPASAPHGLTVDPLRTAPFDRPARVKTLDAAVSVGIWAARHLTEGQQAITLPGGLEVIPELKDILEAHLDGNRDRALSVSAFFGRNLPKLATLDASWVEQNLARIFPADGRSIDLYQAAWRGYILLWNHPYPQVFRLLRAHYEAAVDRIQPAVPEEHEHHDPDRQLARHLMILYWHGEIDWDRENGILRRFFTRASDVLRAEAIQFLGMSLAHERSVPAEVLERMRRIWDIRREATIDKAGHAQEIAAFGWWPVSGKFDEPWATAQLTQILASAGKATPEPQVIEWLAEVAPRYPREAVRCLELFAEGRDWDFHASLWDGEANAILGAALRDSQPETRRAAVDLINRLGSRGLRQFRRLLQGPGGLQQ